jgi:hypothetical protein
MEKMFIKKIATGILFIAFLNGCAQNSAMLGTIITGASSGNVYQAGLSYGTNHLVEKATGRSPVENVIEILKPKNNDNEFEKLVKKRIKKTRKKMNLTNQ